ncbi:hypothetical protein [Legionella clemsonensis]|uniref:Uncharacterized protein n=1 Tax=Legionella clemsonensis TaxID=1867846 RepID=A0A222P2D0_9GAMM|nr:hypothetical protein [Legionella clemsonensis]ASQ45989.1 hypothetical protein clem_07170 [Legionella clemsonensis]
MGSLEDKYPLVDNETFDALIQTQSARAMQYLLLNETNNYEKEINSLAKSCSKVLRHESVTSDFIVDLMEKSMTSNYLQTLKNVQQAIDLCLEKKNKTLVNSFYGGKEADALSKRIAVLEQAKRISPPVIMEQVVRDVLTQAADKHHAIIDRHLYLYNSKNI